MVRSLSLVPLLALLQPLLSIPTPRDDGVQVGGVFDQETRAWLELAMADYGVTGAAMAIVTPEKEGLELFGVKNIWRDEIQSDTYFSIGSNSKWVTGLALATLETYNVTMANGEVFSLDSRMKTIYPELKMTDENATEHVTVAEMFGMVTGLPRHDYSMGMDDNAFITLEKFARLKPSAPYPSDLQQYSTSHYNALTATPEILLGRTLGEFVETEIFKPLGMTATFNATVAKQSNRLSNGFIKANQNITQCGLEVAANKTSLSEACLGRSEAFEYWTDGTGLEQGGGGAVIMTAKDMLVWSKESLKPTVIPQQALDSALYRYDFPTGPNATYGLGVNKALVQDVEFVYHTGAVPGHNSAFVRNMNSGVAVFIIVNDDWALQWAQQHAVTLMFKLSGLEPGALGDPRATLNEEWLTAAESATAQLAYPVEEHIAKIRPPPESIAWKRYTAPGYPDLEIYPIDLSNEDEIESIGLSPDFVLRELNTSATPLLVSPRLDNYYAITRGSFAQRWLFTHFDGPLYNYTIIANREKLGPLESEIVATYESKYTAKNFGVGPCVFAEGGLGMFGGFWAADNPAIAVPAVEESVRENAIAFFTATEDIEH